MGRVWSWETLHDRMWTLVYNYLPPPKLFSELVLNTVYTKIQLLIFSDEFGLRRSLSVSIMCRRAAISDPDTLQRSVLHLLPLICISAACLCVSSAIRSVQPVQTPLALYPTPSLCEVTQRARSQRSQHVVWVSISETSPPYVGLSVCSQSSLVKLGLCSLQSWICVRAANCVYVCVAQIYASFSVCLYVNFVDVPCAGCVWRVLILQQEARVSYKSAVCVPRDATKWPKKEPDELCVALIHLSPLVDPPHAVIHAVCICSYVILRERSAQVDIVAFINVYLHSISGSRARVVNQAARRSHFLPYDLFD